MFVPTHKCESLMMKDKNKLDVKLTPIVILCPYCGSQVQQDERVECECGFVAEAISNAASDVIETADSSCLLNIWEFNGISFLELSPGKEKK